MSDESREFAVPDAVAAPMLALDRSGTVRGVNGAFTQTTGLGAAQVLGLPLASLCAAPNGDRLPELLQACANATPLDALPLTLRGAQAPWPVRASLREHGAALWLTLTDAALEHRAEQLEELLNLVQQFGRLGLWERNLRSMKARWDHQMHRYWGLSPDDPTPDFTTATSYVVPEDRESMRAYFLQAARASGTYALRFRVRGADGVLRRLHAQWAVKNGADGKPERAVGVTMDDTEVWRLAETVVQTHAQLELALQLGGISIWRHDLATNRLYYDDQGWRILGRTPRPEGLSLAEVRELIHPDDLPAVQAAAERALVSTAPTDMEARYRHVDGHWLHVLTRRVTQRDTHGKPVAFVGVALDMTERLGEQHRLLDLTRRLELAASVAGVAIWSYDLDTGEAVWNTQMYVLHGLDPSLPAPDLRTYIARHVAPQHRSMISGNANRMTSESASELLRGDIQIVRADGEHRDVSARVRVIQSEQGATMIGSLIDVTEQRAARRALLDAHERAALAARAVGVGTWEYDNSTQQATWDEQMWRLRGLEPPGPAGVTVPQRQSLVHPDDWLALQREREEASREHRASSVQFRVPWPDGTWHWLASRSMPIFDEHGVEVRRIGVNWDITQTRDAEQSRQERLLAQRESLAKSQFLARMSHELRTPLNAVIGFAQLLLADKNASSDAREQLQHIRAAGEHLLALVNDVLDLSSLDTGEIRLESRPLDLGRLYDAAVPMVAALAAAQGVQLQRGQLANTVLADPTRLRQVLLNLLTNAIKYNRPAGTVQVESEEAGGEVVLRVHDSGRGMSTAQLQHVFEPFNRLGAERRGIEGTGIGLAIVKANVERMGGTVGVRSTPGLGTVFEVRLPSALGKVPAAITAPGELAEAPPAGRTGRLLYIEDNPVNALIVRELIAQRGHLTLDEADDGASGIECARATQPDLILVDMQLPDIDGLEVLRRLRADPSTASIPCIALSANAMPEDIQLALGAGFADYWTKPLDFRVFLSAIDTLFGKGT